MPFEITTRQSETSQLFTGNKDDLRVPVEGTPPKEKPGFLPSLDAEIKANNLGYNLLTDFLNNSGDNLDNKLDTSFNPFSDKYKGYEHVVAEARNTEHADRLIGAYNDRETARNVIHEADTIPRLGAALASGFIDIPNLVLLATAPELLIGKTFLGTTAKAGSVFAAVETPKEIALHQVQPERTIEESLGYIGGAAAAGLLPGAAIGIKNLIADRAASGLLNKLGGKAFQQLPPNQQQQLQANVQAALDPNAMKTGGSLNAARVEETTLADEAVRGDFAMLGVTPNERLAKTPFPFIRELKQKIAVDPWLREKYYQGVAAIEDAETTILRRFTGMTGSYAEQQMRLGKQFANSTPDPEALIKEFNRMGLPIDEAAVRANPKDFTSIGTFKQLVTGALRNGDDSLIPEVKSLAEWVRMNIKNPLGKEALDKGMLDDVIEQIGKKAEQKVTATSPFAKIVDKWRTAIENEKEAIANWKTQSGRSQDIMEAKYRIQDYEQKLVAAEKRLEQEIKDVGEKARQDARAMKSQTSDSYVHRIWNKDAVKADTEGLRKVILKYAQDQENPQEVADAVVSQLLNLNRPLALNQIELIGKAAPLKERLLLIPDNELAPWLINDLETIINKYTRDMVNDLTFKDSFGDKNLTADLARAEQLFHKQVREEVAAMKAAGKSDEEVAAHIADRTRQFQADKQDLDFLVKMVLGDGPDTALSEFTQYTISTVKRWNAMRLLGSVAIANLGDVGRLVSADGLGRWSSAIAHYATNREFFKMTREQAKELGVGLEIFMNHRLQQIGDYLAHDMYAGPGISEKVLSKVIGKSGGSYVGKRISAGFDWLGDRFGKLSGMAYLVTFTKDMASILNANRIARFVGDFKTLATNDKAWLAQHYIDEGMAQRIAAQVAKYGETKDSFTFANIGKWDDAVARETFSNAVWKSVHHVIITPHAGSLPQWMRTPVGGLVTQFQSFTAAAHEQMVVAGLGQRDLLVMEGLLGVLFFASIAVQLRSLAKKGEIETDEKTLFVNTLDASGIGGVGFNMIKSPLQDAIGIEQSRRYRDVSTLGGVLGPTAGSAESVLSMKDHLKNGEIKDKDIHALRTMMPLQNLFYLRQMFDRVEDKMKERYGR